MSRRVAGQGWRRGARVAGLLRTCPYRPRGSRRTLLFGFQNRLAVQRIGGNADCGKRRRRCQEWGSGAVGEDERAIGKAIPEPACQVAKVCTATGRERRRTLNCHSTQSGRFEQRTPARLRGKWRPSEAVAPYRSRYRCSGSSHELWEPTHGRVRNYSAPLRTEKVIEKDIDKHRHGCNVDVSTVPVTPWFPGRGPHGRTEV